MKISAPASRLFYMTLLAGAGLQADPVDLGVTGNLYVAGNTASFGTEGADAGYLLNYVPASDTIQFNATSSAATWLWRQGPVTGYLPQLQLSSSNTLSLFNSGTTTAGLILAPNALSLQGSTSDVFGIQNIAIDATSSQVRLIVGDNALQTYETDRLSIGATDYATSTWYPRFTVKATGNVGVGTETPSERLEVSGNIKITGGTITTPSVTLPDGSTLTTARTNTLYNTAGTAVASVATDGKVNFVNGLSVGTGGSPATITPSSAAYLNQTLANLGYREGAATTPMKTIPTTGLVSINAITQDASFVYVAGICSDNGTIGGIDIWGSPASSGFVAKLNTLGVAQWVKTLRGSSAVNFNAITVDGSGNVLVAGSFYGTTTGYNNPAIDLTSNSNAGPDALLVKYNASGVSQWAQRVGGTSADLFNSVAVDGSGNVVAAGYFTGTTTGLSSPASNLSSNNSGNCDAFVVKYNSSGVSQWAQRVGGTNADLFNSVAVDGSGNIVAAGYFNGITTGLSSPASNLTSNGGNGYPDAFVIKYNASGASQWAQRVGSPNSDMFYSVAVDGSGNIVAAGFFTGTTTGLSSPAGNLSANGGTYSDAFVVKYNASGASQWAQRAGGSSYDIFNSVAVDGSGNIVAAGYFTGTTTGLSSPAGNLTSNTGSQDGLLVKYDAAGTSQIADKFSGSSSDSFIRVSLLGSSIWVTGNAGGPPAVPFGDIRTINSFALGWSGLPVVTPTTGVSETLAWGGSGANNAGVALGTSAYASAQGSAALGSSIATAKNAFSTGSSSATGIGAVAVGVDSRATGYGATAMGTYVTATGYGSTAMGLNSSASGMGATAMGEAYASGSASTAIGSNAYATNFAATAIGSETSANGYASVAMGLNLIGQSYASTVVGSLNIPQGDPNDWVETDDLFVIGNGDSLYEWTPRNALTVHKNGNTRILGTVQAKGGFRTPPMGDIGMGDFKAGPTPSGQTTDGSSSPVNLDDGLRYSGE